jgi:hypothetical protein
VFLCFCVHGCFDVDLALHCMRRRFLGYDLLGTSALSVSACRYSFVSANLHELGIDVKII